jgi:hypothetical protein
MGVFVVVCNVASSMVVELNLKNKTLINGRFVGNEGGMVDAAFVAAHCIVLVATTLASWFKLVRFLCISLGLGLNHLN